MYLKSRNSSNFIKTGPVIFKISVFTRSNFLNHFYYDYNLFAYRDEKQLVIHTEDSVASVGYLNLKLRVEQKADFDGEIILPPAVRNAFDFKDLSDSVFSDISDIEESELESIEKLKIEEEKKQKELNPNISYDGNANNRSDDVDNSNEEETEDGYYYDEGHNENDRFPIIDHSSIYGNGHGWFYIGGIVGEASDTAMATEDAINKLISR